MTIAQWRRLDLLQPPKAPNAKSQIGRVAPAAQHFIGVGEDRIVLGAPALYEATGFGNEVSFLGPAPHTKTHWCRAFKVKIRRRGGGAETVTAVTLPTVCSIWTSQEKTHYGLAVLYYVS